MTRRGSDARPLPKRTREALTACEAVSLHYWADHPRAHHVWAVDDHQRAHVVRINRDDGTAQHACRAELLVATCTGDDEAVPYIALDNNLSQGEQQMTTQKEPPPQGEAVQDPQASPYQEGSPMANVSHPTPDLPTTEPSANGSRPAEVVYDPLKLSSLRSKSSVLKGVSTMQSRVPIEHRPAQGVWVRVRPGETYTEIIDLLVATNTSNSADRNNLYVVTDAVRPDLEMFVRPHKVAVGMTYHDKVIFLWVRSLSVGNNSWTDSALKAMTTAQTAWVTMETDQPLSEYKVHVAPNNSQWGEPKWPDQTLEELVMTAFRDRVIRSLDHPIAARLLGLDV
jgi:hypothetical protein